MKLIPAIVPSVRDFVIRMMDGEAFYLSVHSTTYKYYYDKTKTRPFVVMNLDTAVVQPWNIDDEVICRLQVEEPWYAGLVRGGHGVLCWVGLKEEQAQGRTQAAYIVNYVGINELPFKTRHNAYSHAIPVLPEELKY